MLTPGVKGLLIANGVVYFLQMTIGVENEAAMVRLFGLTPALVWKHLTIWQPLTYMFLHGSFSHLLFNMFALWMFGITLESVWGTKQFLKYYFLTGIGAGLFNCIFTPGMPAVIIGASGSVFGLLAAFGLLFPDAKIYIWMLVPIRAKYLVLIFGVFTFMSSLSPGSSTIAHLVHLGGMVIGIIYLRKDYMLRWGARKAKNIQVEKRVQKETKKEDDEDRLRHEVDDLLDKINEVGLRNLTTWERRRLREASELLKRIEEEQK